MTNYGMLSDRQGVSLTSHPKKFHHLYIYLGSGKKTRFVCFLVFYSQPQNFLSGWVIMNHQKLGAINTP
jgi:hypothetical protein